MIWNEALLAPGLVKPVVEFGHTFAKITLCLYEAAGFLHAGFGQARVEIAAATLKKVGQLRRDDRVHATHVGAHRIQLSKRTQDIISMSTLGIHRVPNDDLARALTMTVDTPVPLLHHIRIVRNF